MNDSVLLAQKIWLDPNSSKFTKVLEKFNVRTGNFESLITAEESPASNFTYDVNSDKDLIVTGDYGKDRLLFFDLSGSLIKCILGPEYKSKERLIAFSNIEITDKYILGVYSGCKIVPNMKAYELDMLGKKIVIMDHKGEYIATLKTDASIIDIKYHQQTGKLYLSLAGEIQIGSINLDEVLSGNAVDVNGNEKSASSSGSPNQPPVLFFDNDNKPTDRWELGKIAVGGCSFQVVQCDEKYPGERFEIDTVIVSPNFIGGKLGLNFMMAGLITNLIFDISENAPLGDFQGEVEVYGKGFDSPAVLPISGTIVNNIQ